MRSKSHEQDGERLSLAATPLPATASGDPAMAFEPFMSALPQKWKPVLQKSSQA
jgi:hypothetical protein